MSKESVEEYMQRHQFLEADKKKVRDFLANAHAVDAYLTRNELRYTDHRGTQGIIGRGQLGLQDNFI